MAIPCIHVPPQEREWYKDVPAFSLAFFIIELWHFGHSN